MSRSGARLNDGGAFVFFHPGECADGRLTAFYLSNLLGNPYETAVAIGHLTFGGVFERYPDITFLLRAWRRRAADARRPLRARLCHRPPRHRHQGGSRRARYSAMSASTASSTIRMRLRLPRQVFGETQIVFGSDWPFPMGLIEPHRQMAALDPAQRKRIFCDNPERILKETTS